MHTPHAIHNCKHYEVAEWLSDWFANELEVIHHVP